MRSIRYSFSVELLGKVQKSEATKIKEGPSMAIQLRGLETGSKRDMEREE